MSSFEVLLLILACLRISDAATDTINLGDKLNSSDHLVSQSGAVTLRFYKQEYGETWNDKDSGYYLAIWYTEDSLNHPIWLANRDNPIADDSGVLLIDSTGLKITHAGGNPIQLFSLQPNSTDNSNFKVVLQDSGNLVFLYANWATNVLWQSFDHPTDTFLPGMKLGVGLGGSWSLASWLTRSMPAPGALTLKWDPVGKQLVVWLRERVLWTTGENFDNLPFLDQMNINFYFTNASSVDEQYLSYRLLIDQNTPEEQRKNARLVLRHDGSLIHGSGIIISLSTTCTGNSAEIGCERWEGPKCRSNGSMYEIRSITTPENSVNNSLMGNQSLSINDCMDICWKDCLCLGVNDVRGLGCQFLSGPYAEAELGGIPYRVIIQRGSNGTDYNRPGKDNNRSGTDHNEIPYIDAGSSIKTWIWILISLATALTITIPPGTLFCLRRRQQLRREEKFLRELMTSEISELQTGNNGHSLNIYTAASIMSATNGFSPDNLLGKGGFGPVFKGTLPDGQEVAIKRLSRGSGQGLVEFKNELILIAKLQHTNLVRLLGFCVQGEDKMLVYEYMPNKSLDFFIFADESKRKLLDWDKRFSIIEGIAQGLLYLHKYSRLKIIHRDLKVSNILLDENMNPKISDFGMARIYKTNEAESNTNRIVGTYGYMPPEYAMDGIFSVKSDVYSFGVLMLEVVSGRKNTSSFHFERPLNLVGYTWELWKRGAAVELVDPTLSDSCSEHQVLRCITLGLLCTENSPRDRPTMSDVVYMLTGEMQLPLPKHPAFSTGKSITETNAGKREMENHSLNGLSMSELDPR